MLSMFSVPSEDLRIRMVRSGRLAFSLQGRLRADGVVAFIQHQQRRIGETGKCDAETVVILRRSGKEDAVPLKTLGMAASRKCDLHMAPDRLAKLPEVIVLLLDEHHVWREENDAARSMPVKRMAHNFKRDASLPCPCRQNDDRISIVAGGFIHQPGLVISQRFGSSHGRLIHQPGRVISQRFSSSHGRLIHQPGWVISQRFSSSHGRLEDHPAHCCSPLQVPL